MKQTTYPTTKIIQYILTMMLVLLPTVVHAAPQEPHGEGVAFRIAYEQGRYALYMRSSATPEAPALTLTAQVTIRVPHAVGDEQFQIAGLTPIVPGTTWAIIARVNAPQEDPASDYISFGLEFPTGDHKVLTWVAEEEVRVFTFENAAPCFGAVALLENDDAFMAPNSVHTNPGNQIDILGLGGGNAYTSSYGGSAVCTALSPFDGGMGPAYFTAWTGPF